MAVIPAKAGIHLLPLHQGKWIPVFAGMTAMKDARKVKHTPTSKRKQLVWRGAA